MSAEFDRLVERAFWHAEETVVRPIAFVLMISTDGRESLQRIVGAADSQQVVEVGLSFVAQSAPTLRAYAIASDGYLRRKDGARFDAVFLHCAVRGEPEGVEIARPYEDDGTRVRWTQPPIVMRATRSFLEGT